MQSEQQRPMPQTGSQQYSGSAAQGGPSALQASQHLQTLRVIRRRILDLDLTVAKTLGDIAERRLISDDLSASDVHAIVNTFDNVVADYFSPERWRPLHEAMGSAAWPHAEWQLALQRVDQAIAGIADRRRAIRRSDLLFEKIVLDELGLRCHLIRRAISGEASGARELIQEIQYYRRIQRSDPCSLQQQQPQSAAAAAAAAAAADAAADAAASVRFNAKVNVKEFKMRQ